MKAQSVGSPIQLTSDPNVQTTSGDTTASHTSRSAQPDIPVEFVKLQAGWRAIALRRKISVVGDENGIVTVNIHGGPDVFAKMGFDNKESEKSLYPKTLHYKAGDAKKFEVNVVGGDQIHLPFSRTADELHKALFRGTPVESWPAHAFVNGSFYNDRTKADGGRPEHATIGSAPTLTREAAPSTKVPKGYEGDYAEVNFGKTSLHTGPQLSLNGKPIFSDDKLEKPRFQYNSNLRPGELRHANHSNPRSGMSLPANIGYGKNSLSDSSHPALAGRSRLKQPSQFETRESGQDAVRLVSVPATRRGAVGNGMTMPEFSRAMARIDQLNATKAKDVAFATAFASRSFNLDGGFSLYNAKLDKDGKHELDVGDSHAGAPNYVAISKRPDK